VLGGGEDLEIRTLLPRSYGGVQQNEGMQASLPGRVPILFKGGQGGRKTQEKTKLRDTRLGGCIKRKVHSKKEKEIWKNQEGRKHLLASGNRRGGARRKKGLQERA